MKKSGEVLWFLVMVFVLGVIFAGTPLLAKGQGKGQGRGNEKKEKKEPKSKKEKKEKKEKTQKIQKVASQSRMRVYTPPVTGSIQKNAKKYRYVYYPNIEMYHNRDTDRYFWLQNGKWMSAQTMPDWARVKYLPKIALDEYYLTPYADHPWVMQSFPTGPEVTGIVMKPTTENGPPPQAPAYGYRRKYNYHFYPQTNVYYNVETKRYFWTESGNWRFGIERPLGIALDEGTKTTMVLNSPFPY